MVVAEKQKQRRTFTLGEGVAFIISNR